MAAGDKARVTIVGAGVAGMTAALRLLEAGHSVEVLERSNEIGGKFGAVERNGEYHEHAYHIFAAWCLNFWDLASTIGLRRGYGPGSDFEDRPTFKVLRPNTYVFNEVRNVASPDYFWANVNSGVADWSHMLIYAYSLLDLLSDQSLDREEFLNRVGVNGYLRSKPYVTDVAALLHHELLLKVFAVPSYETSARAYQKYVQLSFAFPSAPTFEVLTGNCMGTFWRRFEHKAEETAGRKNAEFVVRRSTELKQILVKEGRVTGIRVRPPGDRVKGYQSMEDRLPRPTANEDRSEWRFVPVDRLVIAIPPNRLFDIVNDSVEESPELIEKIPELLDLTKVPLQQIAALDLCFNRKLDGIPAEHVTLLDEESSIYDSDDSELRKNGLASRFGLSFIDHAQLWRDWKTRPPTFLSILATDVDGLKELTWSLDAVRKEVQKRPAKDQTAAERTRVLQELNEVLRGNAPWQIISELARYVKFAPADIDWERSGVEPHHEEPLFVNTVGSWQYRPEVRPDPAFRGHRIHERIHGLYLAGDYCRSKIDIVSVEAAIVTGILAARAIDESIPPPIPPREPDFDKVEEGKRILTGWLELARMRSRRLTEDIRRRVAPEALERKRRMAGQASSQGTGLTARLA